MPEELWMEVHYIVQMVKVIQSCLTLCNAMNCPWNSPGKNIAWVAFRFSRGYSKPRDWIQISCIAGRFFTSWAKREALYRWYLGPKSLQSCLTLWDPMYCSPPGSSVHGISQTRILEWVAISFSRRSSQPRDWTCVSCLLHWKAGSLPLVLQGSYQNHPQEEDAKMQKRQNGCLRKPYK